MEKLSTEIKSHLSVLIGVLKLIDEIGEENDIPQLAWKCYKDDFQDAHDAMEEKYPDEEDFDIIDDYTQEEIERRDNEIDEYINKLSKLVS